MAKTIFEEIERLKKEKNAIILAHNYQVPEIQDAADFVGDSLELSRKATETNADIIVFAGVDFMAETAKVLNSNKKVILPEPDARCPMAAMLKIDYLKTLQEEYPDAETVLYVNTHVDAKALCDCVCTSANADRVVNAMDSDTVIFGPDKNLAYYVEKRTEKKIIRAPPTGICIVHDRKMTLHELNEAKAAHPNAEVVVHPETIPSLQDAADAIASTSGMIRYCKQSDSKEFIIGTENELVYRLQKEMPEKKFYYLSERAICANMKKNTIEKVLSALKNEGPEIEIDDETTEKSRKAIQRMLDLSK